MIKKNLVYVSQHAIPIIDGFTDIVLSPEFYWVKSIELSNSSKRQVQSMAESIYVGTLSQGEYQYRVENIAMNKWLIIAYSQKHILDTLKNLELPLDKIKRVYFSQSLLSKIDSPVQINQVLYLAKIDNIICQISMKMAPKDFITISRMLGNIYPKNPVQIGTLQNKIITEKSYFQLLTIATFFTMALILQTLQSYKSLSHIEREKKSLFSTTNLPETSFERESILSPLRKKALSIEKNFSLLTPIQKLPQEYRKELISLVLEENQLILSFSKKIQPTSSFLQELLKKNYTNVQNIKDDNYIVVKFSL